MILVSFSVLTNYNTLHVPQVTLISSHALRESHENLRHIVLAADDIMTLAKNNTLELRRWAKIHEVLEQQARSHSNSFTDANLHIK